MSAGAAIPSTREASAAPDAPRADKTIPSLDGVRALAILLVLADRFAYVEFNPADAAPVRLLTHAMSVGWIGVQLFFVLSGYLITNILLAARGSDNYFGAFYGRRTLRIFPLYYGFLVLLLVLAWIPGVLNEAQLASQHNRLWAWLYLQNWTQPFGIYITPGEHFWSLAVEEQFYLLWPLVVSRCSVKGVAWLSGALVLCAIAFRLGVWLTQGDASPAINYHFTFARMDALAIGAGLAALLRLERGRAFLAGHLRSIAWAGVALAAVSAWLTKGGYPTANPVGEVLGYTMLALMFGALILAAILGDEAYGGVGAQRSGAVARLFRLPVLRSIGKYSYAMYVFHSPLHELAGRPLLMALGVFQASRLWQNLVYDVVATVVTYLLAFASYHLYEKHFLKLKPAYRGPAAGSA